MFHVDKGEVAHSRLLGAQERASESTLAATGDDARSDHAIVPRGVPVRKPPDGSYALLHPDDLHRDSNHFS